MVAQSGDRVELGGGGGGGSDPSALKKSANLSDLASAGTARTNLGLGGAAILGVGTGAGTVAAGNDSRLAGAVQKSANLSDLASAGTARTNLGLGGAATVNIGTTAGTVAAGDDSRLVGAVQTDDVRLGAFYNVRSYGTFGDATTTLTAIQAAIDACSAAGGGIVYLPPGTYQTSGSIRPKSNVVFRGAGEATVIRAAFTGHTIASSAGVNLSNFVVEDMKFLGPVTSTPSIPTRTRTTSGAGADVAIWIDGDLDTATPGSGIITNIEVRRVVVEATTWLPIRLFGIRGTVKVTGCTFRNCEDAGWGFNEEVIVTACSSLNSADNGFSLSRGNRKVTITGCTVENAAYYGIWLSGFTGTVGPEDFACTGNVMRGVGTAGIALMDAPTYGTITGNTIDKMGYRGAVETPDDATCCGIYVKGQSSNGTTPTTFSKGLLIANNTIRNAPRAGICINGATGLKVAENLIVDCGSQYLADGTTQVTSSYTSQNVGIILEVPATVTNSSITGNDVIDTRATPYCNLGVYPSTAVASVTIAGNRMVGCRNATNLPLFVRSDTLGQRAGADETMPRWAASSINSITMSTGSVRFAYFTATRSRTVTQLSLSCGSTAAGATPTMVKYALYSVAANGDLTQIGVTASDTSIFSTAGGVYPRNLLTPVGIVEGQLYAVAAIVVTSAAAPTAIGSIAGTPTDNAVTPRLSGVLTVQSDLLTSYTAASVAVSQSILYVAVI